MYTYIILCKWLLGCSWFRDYCFFCTSFCFLAMASVVANGMILLGMLVKVIECWLSIKEKWSKLKFVFSHFDIKCVVCLGNNWSHNKTKSSLLSIGHVGYVNVCIIFKNLPISLPSFSFSPCLPSFFSCSLLPFLFSVSFSSAHPHNNLLFPSPFFIAPTSPFPLTYSLHLSLSSPAPSSIVIMSSLSYHLKCVHCRLFKCCGWTTTDWHRYLMTSHNLVIWRSWCVDNWLLVECQ